MTFDEQIEKQVIGLIAADRLHIPISSIDNKLKRMKPTLAKDIPVSDSYEGERVYARVDAEDKMKTRGMKEGIELFEQQFPRYAKILKGMIEEKRAEREVYLCFGTNPDCRLTSEDYMGVMKDLGFTEIASRSLYPVLMNVSRNLQKSRDNEERSVLIG